MYFHSFRNPGLVVDILSGKKMEQIYVFVVSGNLYLIYELYLIADLRRLNTMATKAVNSGMIIIGGGVVKHHICNANLMV